MKGVFIPFRVYFYDSINSTCIKRMLQMKGGRTMVYHKPKIKEFEVPLEVKTISSETTSCIGGHCVRARYGED